MYIGYVLINLLCLVSDVVAKCDSVLQDKKEPLVSQ